MHERGARADFGFALGWIAFGAAVLVASWRMDRLQSLGINPWSAPGLVPGLLGLLIVVFGAALAWRATVQGALRAKGASGSGSAIRRAALALVLCLGYGAGLLGRALPFWLTSAAFLFVTIFAFRAIDRDAETTGSFGGLALSTAAISLIASAVISFVFQEIFLVRLP